MSLSVVTFILLLFLYLFFTYNRTPTLILVVSNCVITNLNFFFIPGLDPGSPAGG